MDRDAAPEGKARITDVRGRAASGASLLIVANLFSRGIGIFSIAALARLLTPNDFGIVSLATIVVEFAQVLTDFQLINVLVRLPRRDEHLYVTAFTMALIRGLLTAIGIAAAAVPAALLMHNDHVRNVLLVLAIVPLIDGLRSPRVADFLRDIDFSRDATVSITGRVVSLVVMVALAFATRSYWALVAGTITASVVMCAMTYAMKPFRPRLGLRDYREFLGFGGWMSGAAIVNYAGSKIDSLLVAGHFSIARFGQYNMGMQIAVILTNHLAEPFQRAIFSALSLMQDDLPRRLRAYAMAQATILGVLLPIGIGTTLIAHEAIMVLAGPKWNDAVWVLRFVAPPMALGTITVGAQALLMAEGDTRTIFLRNVTAMTFKLTMLSTGLYLFGLRGLMAAWTISGFFYLYITLRLVSQRFGIPLRAPFVLAWRSIAAAAAMAVAVLAFGLLVGDSGNAFARNLALLVAKAAVGGLAYAGTHAMLWRMAGRPDGFERFVIDHAGRMLRPIRRRLSPHGA